MDNKEKVKIISDWLDDHINSLDPGTDEIAHLIINELLIEHSCCDSQTWEFNNDIYMKILRADEPRRYDTHT